MATDVVEQAALAKPARIKTIQTVTLALLFIAGIVNFLDRSSLSVAGEAIRGELGLSATEFGVLLSAFSLSYGLSQLPAGILLDRFGPRLVLGAGLIFWSAMQALTGMVNSFSHFIGCVSASGLVKRRLCLRRKIDQRLVRAKRARHGAGDF